MRRNGLKVALIAAAAVMIADNAYAQERTGLSFGAGIRKDALEWNIAGDNSGENPNVLSELSWSDLDIFQISLGVSSDLGPEMHLKASAGYGWITDGENQDSDYSSDNRTLERSRSNNSADDGNVMDLSAAIVFKRNVLPYKGWDANPLLGLSFHRQELKIKDGVQTIPATGPFEGLDSSYDANWFGPYVGLDIAYSTDGLRLLGALEAHAVYYYADADWNLRSDLEHPKSFEHRAFGGGGVASIGAEYAFTSKWSATVDAKYSHFITSDGSDKTFFADGSAAYTQLNRVEWSSLSGMLRVNYIF